MDLNHPLVGVLAVLISTAVGVAPFLLLQAWESRRLRRRWELQDQLREIEDQIWLDSLPEWQREAMERGRQQRAEIKREARRRLGLPEEEGDDERRSR
jgi:hypothetical protein